MKYTTKQCRGFYLPQDPSAQRVDFFDVVIALESWDEVEDQEDEGIFFYMDGQPLQVGAIVSDGFVITEIEDDEPAAQPSDWIEIPTAALVHRSELPAMTAEQEQHFAAHLADRLGAYLPSGAEWMEEVQIALEECEITTKENANA